MTIDTRKLYALVRSITHTVKFGGEGDEGGVGTTPERERLADFAESLNLNHSDFATLLRVADGEPAQQ